MIPLGTVLQDDRGTFLLVAADGPSVGVRYFQGEVKAFPRGALTRAHQEELYPFSPVSMINNACKLSRVSGSLPEHKLSEMLRGYSTPKLLELGVAIVQELESR